MRFPSNEVITQWILNQQDNWDHRIPEIARISAEEMSPEGIQRKYFGAQSNITIDAFVTIMKERLKIDEYIDLTPGQIQELKLRADYEQTGHMSVEKREEFFKNIWCQEEVKRSILDQGRLSDVQSEKLEQFGPLFHKAAILKVTKANAPTSPEFLKDNDTFILDP